MKKIIITVITVILVTFSSHVSAQNTADFVVIQTTKCQNTNTNAHSYRWVATMANNVKYTVTMIVYENFEVQSYIRIKTQDPNTGMTTIEDLPVAPGAENVQMYLSKDRTKMSVYYYGSAGPVTVDIEDIL